MPHYGHQLTVPLIILGFLGTLRDRAADHKSKSGSRVLGKRHGARYAELKLHCCSRPIKLVRSFMVSSLSLCIKPS